MMMTISSSSKSKQQQQLKRKRILNETQRAEATKRERKRMLRLNEAFERLRQILPMSELTKSKLSRVETLKYAIEYMRSMVDYLNNSYPSVPLLLLNLFIYLYPYLLIFTVLKNKCLRIINNEIAFSLLFSIILRSSSKLF